MKAEDFVCAVQRHVIDGTVEDTVAVLHDPPGRSPAAELLSLSRWYLSLAEPDREMARRLMTMVARDTVFGLFSLLDGASMPAPFADSRAYFELRYVTPAGAHVFCGPSGEVLHELL